MVYERSGVLLLIVNVADRASVVAMVTLFRSVQYRPGRPALGRLEQSLNMWNVVAVGIFHTIAIPHCLLYDDVTSLMSM